MVDLHITRGELAEILPEKLADNSRNSRGLPGGLVGGGHRFHTPTDRGRVIDSRSIP